MTYLATALQAFFTDYAHTQRNLSANTIASYRDTWRLLIKDLSVTAGTSADQLRLEDLDRGTVTVLRGGNHQTLYRRQDLAQRQLGRQCHLRQTTVREDGDADDRHDGSGRHWTLDFDCGRC